MSRRSLPAKVVDKDPINQAVDLLLENDVDLSTLFNQEGLLKQLTKRLVEKALQAEMNEHLGYDKYTRSDNENTRNGVTTKNLITESGNISITVPRDRNATFEPLLVQKRQTRIDGLDQKILSLYAKGMSISDIRIQLEELYGADISESLISKITDDVLDEVKLWQSRPLEGIYPVVFFDCLMVKVRSDKRILNKAVYVALGVDLTGKKDVLGLWISENEGAKFWLNNLTELQNRGLKDILIACTDNLTGMNEAIAVAYPKTSHQLCIVHQIRNSLKYVSYKDYKKVTTDLKTIYQSATEDEALLALDAFASKWKHYPQIAKSWYANWDNLMIFIGFPAQIRTIIYTTNAIESLNSQLRKVTKNKRIFPNDNSVFKTLYLTIEYIVQKWTCAVRNWNVAMPHFMILFADRLGAL